MSGELLLSDDARSTAGILLLTVVAVEYGGTFMLRVVRGRVPMTPFQRSFARAGHAHAGVLVIAALVCQLLADAADVSGLEGTVDDLKDGGEAVTGAGAEPMAAPVETPGETVTTGSRLVEGLATALSSEIGWT